MSKLRKFQTSDFIRMRQIQLAMIFAFLVLSPQSASLVFGAAVAPVEGDKAMRELSRLKLGALSGEDEKARYLNTIQLEKSRISQKMLGTLYENAMDLYRDGDYERSAELASTILTIDSTHQDAAALKKASLELKGTGKVILNQRRLVEKKFEEGMELYRQKRLVEASAVLEETSKLSPSNLKIKYWTRRVGNEIADEHFRRGQKAYQEGKLDKALEQWYSCLARNPAYPRISATIARVEAEHRESQANAKIQEALTLYNQDDKEGSYRAFEETLRLDPANSRAANLLARVRSEIVSGIEKRARQHYQSREYAKSMEEIRRALQFGYEEEKVRQWIAQVKERLRKEEERKKEAERKAKEEEERKKKEEEEKAVPSAQPQPAGAGEAPVRAVLPTQEARQASQQHYLNGVIYFQQKNFEKAREEFTLALQLDPTNLDAATFLKRIQQQLGP